MESSVIEIGFFVLHKHLYGFIFAHEPPYKTYSSVGQAGFRCCFSMYEPPYEILC